MALLVAETDPTCCHRQTNKYHKATISQKVHLTKSLSIYNLFQIP